MNNLDLKRITAQQIVIYMKLKKNRKEIKWQYIIA